MDRKENGPVHGHGRAGRPLAGALAFALVVIALGLWDGRSTTPPAALGQIPDTAMQRHQLLEEARRTNQLLSAILEHLRTEPIRVQSATTTNPDVRRDSSPNASKQGGS